MLRFQSPLNAGETRVLTFDMSADLATGETLVGAPVVTVTTLAGTDPSPQSILQRTTFDSTNTKMLLQVHPLISACEYSIATVVSTSNPAKTLALPAILSVL